MTTGTWCMCVFSRVSIHKREEMMKHDKITAFVGMWWVSTDVCTGTHVQLLVTVIDRNTRQVILRAVLPVRNFVLVKPAYKTTVEFCLYWCDFHETA